MPCDHPTDAEDGDATEEDPGCTTLLVLNKACRPSPFHPDRFAPIRSHFALRGLS